KNTEKFSERDRDGGNRSGLHDQKQRPAVQKSHRRAVGFAKEDINTARTRHHRCELGTAERSRHCKQTGNYPPEQEPSRRAAQTRRFRRRNENARADHRPDHDHGGVDRPKCANQTARLLVVAHPVMSSEVETSLTISFLKLAAPWSRRLLFQGTISKCARNLPHPVYRHEHKPS